MRTLLTFVLVGCMVVFALIYYSTQAAPHTPSIHLVTHSLKVSSFPTHQTGHEDYPTVARNEAQAAGIPPVLFVRQINEESGFNPNAVSPAGAIGIAQFMPTTAASLGVNPYNPYAALKAAARLMASYVKRYGGNFAMALAAYNAGSGWVQRAVTRCGVRWRSCLPIETQHYISIILKGA